MLEAVSIPTRLLACLIRAGATLPLSGAVVTFEQCRSYVCTHYSGVCSTKWVSILHHIQD